MDKMLSLSDIEIVEKIKIYWMKYQICQKVQIQILLHYLKNYTNI